MREPRAPLRLSTKLVLAARIWLTFLVVRRRIRSPLPELVGELGRGGAQRSRRREDPRRLARGVHRALRVGRRRPTCIVASLVLFRLLRRQGEAADVVIGLPAEPTGKNAHAWVELDGCVIGPPPGRLGHIRLARFP
jgi:hypothetical protein